MLNEGNNQDRIIYVDEWVPREEDCLLKPVKAGIIMPISAFWTKNASDIYLDTFNLSPKKCYSKIPIIDHFCLYINYLEKFYDTDKYLMSVYAKIKIMIDTIPAYDADDLRRDIRNLILFSPFAEIVKRMNEDNFIIKIDPYSNRNEVLKYERKHALALMECSLFQIIIIPLLSHFIFRKGITEMDPFFVKFYHDIVVEMHPEMNLLVKLSATVELTVNRSYNKDHILWDKQFLRARNVLSHSMETVNNIIIQIMPKYIYSKNIIFYNSTSINSMIGYKITGAKYDFSYRPLSSHGGTDEDNSALDKFESRLAKKNESLFLHSQVNYETTMALIEKQFGPFSQEEIDYYKINLSKNKKSPIDELQKELVFYIFYKRFGDSTNIKMINLTGYIKLIIAAKRLLSSQGLHTMEAVVSGKFVKSINRINVNKKELAKIQSSYLYSAIVDKYKNEKIVKYVLTLLATIISSKYQYIDFENQENTGKPFKLNPDLFNEEFLMFVKNI